MSLNVLVRQASLLDFCPIEAAVESLASRGDIDERGAIYTRLEVVEFMLDIAGYTSDRPLHRLRLLEPSFGKGDFLLPAIDRLLAAWQADPRQESALDALSESLRAVELHRETFLRTKAAVIARLISAGMDAPTVTEIASRWLVHGDFLLADVPTHFDLVVGNPPYVRQELIPAVLMAEYRSRYRTIYDRADLYIPFIERALTSLAPGGVLAFICADRWMKNRYGGPLRDLVAQGYHLRIHVDMTDTPAFHSEVVAYPAIVAIAREPGSVTRVAWRPEIDSQTLGALAAELLAPGPPRIGGAVREVSGVTAGAEPWMLGHTGPLALVRRLELNFPTLEEAGCRVGIGVATGADSAFIGNYEELDVESDRKLPLVTTRDISDGTVKWRGLGVINPFDDSGGLVNLADYPRLRRYLAARKDDIAARHCAKKNPAQWFRTIDRITPSLAGRPKLLIPDIKGEAHVVHEACGYYPHHNLYFIVADAWDLRALQAVLLSGIARLFVATYSTRMRGGFLRFQAQYLRRIRVPQWQSVPPHLRIALRKAAEAADIEACRRATCELYGLSEEESVYLGESQ